MKKGTSNILVKYILLTIFIGRRPFAPVMAKRERIGSIRNCQDTRLKGRNLINVISI